MKIPDIYYGVVLALIIPTLLYSGADFENDETSELEEMVFPRKWKKTKFPFLFTGKPVHKLRFRAYCKEILAQIMVAVYVLLILGFFVCTASFEFMSKPFFMFYGVGCAILAVLFQVGFYIFLKIWIKYGKGKKIYW